MKDSQVFTNAIGVLLERGFAKGRIESSDGAVCVNGACNVARFGVANVVIHHIGLDNYLHEPTLSEAVSDLKLPPSANGVMERWDGAYLNDLPSTTVDVIVDVLERAAKIAEQREADGH